MNSSRARTTGWAVAAACAVACSIPAAASATASGAAPNAGTTQLCNGTWQPAPTNGLPKSFSAWDVKVFGPNDVVLSGAYDDSKNDQSAIAHWNGTRWTMTNIPRGTYGGHLAGSSSHDLFVETELPSGKSMIAHLHGDTWSMIPEAKAFGGDDGAINAMVSTKPGDLWAVGPRFTAVGATAVVTHYSGAPGTPWPTTSRPHRGRCRCR